MQQQRNISDDTDFIQDYLSFITHSKQQSTVHHQILHDEIQYMIFLKHHLLNSSSQQEQQQKELQELQDNIIQLTHKLTSGYIWQREQFKLCIKYASSHSVLTTAKDKATTNEDGRDDDSSNQKYTGPYLYGSVKFGENVDDEWFIVYLLYEISKQFPDCIIHTFDNDGPFLLIEAALFLPDWLQDNTESNQHRVFIHRGQLHWIPNAPMNPSQISLVQSNQTWWMEKEFKSIFHAVLVFASLIQTGKDYLIKSTAANKKTQQAIQRRIKLYPEKIWRDIHYARIYLPKSIQYLIQENEQFISYLVRAFVERDAESMKHTIQMKRLLAIKSVGSSAISSTNIDCSFCIIKMTKCLYAQLQSQRFSPPRILRNVFSSDSTTDNNAMDMGAKLTCGFEMLYHESVSQSSDMEEQIDLEKNEKWIIYLQRLKHMNYFREEMEGSALYKQLYKQAKESFLQQHEAHKSNEDDTTATATTETVSHWIDTTLEQYSPDSLKPSDRLQEDDDSWMDTGEGLDEFIDMKCSQQKDEDEPNLTEEQLLQKKADEMIKGVKSFIESMSSFEGAEVPNNASNKRGNNMDKKLEELFSGLKLEDLLDEEELNENLDDDGAYYDDDEEEGEEYMESYMAAMDEQLEEEYGSNLSHQSTVNDYELIKNLLESYKAQAGGAGPLGNLMREMGIDIPDDTDDT